MKYNDVSVKRIFVNKTRRWRWRRKALSVPKCFQTKGLCVQVNLFLSVAAEPVSPLLHNLARVLDETKSAKFISRCSSHSQFFFSSTRDSDDRYTKHAFSNKNCQNNEFSFNIFSLGP